MTLWNRQHELSVSHLRPAQCVCTYQRSAGAMWCLSISLSLCSPQRRCSPSLPASFATARQLFITSRWLASELSPTVSDCSTAEPKYCLLFLPHKHTHTLDLMEVCRGGGGEDDREFSFFPLFFALTCVAEAVDRPAWTEDGGQIRRYQTEGRRCEHCHHKRRLHSPWSSFFFISTMREGNYGHSTFYYVVGQLCLYPTIMSKAKKKSKTIKSS